MKLRHQQITRYIMPMREGGSLPVLAEADDGFKYVVKLRGAGHGAKALIAELVGGEIARALGLNVPELVFLDLPHEFAITEPDIEVQELMKKSEGLNIGLHFLSSALAIDPFDTPVDAATASAIVWLDAFLTNVDRTARNTNMLQWHNSEVWLIDQGASLYFQHSGTDAAKASLTPFPYIKDHLLLRKASMLAETDARFHRVLSPDKIDVIVSLIPDEWLVTDGENMPPETSRDVYRTFLKTRFENSKIFTDHAIEARKSL